MQIGEEREKFFIGSRLNGNRWEYLLTIPGKVCNILVESLLRNPNIMNGEWKMTRLDVQLTLGKEFTSKKEICKIYWQFFEAQMGLESTKKKGREVSIEGDESFISVHIGKHRHRKIL